MQPHASYDEAWISYTFPFLGQRDVCFSIKNEKCIKVLLDQQSNDETNCFYIIQLWVNGFRN